MSGISYELIEGGKRGRLLADQVFTDSIRGHRLHYRDSSLHFDLYPSGDLVVYAGSVWDFGTGAIDTPAMVVASLEHDCICAATNARKLPWSARFDGDKNLFSRLGENGATVSRWWRTPGVMVYSQLVARWRDKG